MSIDAKFSLESDFTGPDAANRRNLEDCNDLTNQIGGFPMPYFSRKNRGSGSVAEEMEEPKDER